MTKKKNTPKKVRQKQSADFSKLPSKALAQQANGHYEAGEFARAIEMYRHLIKTSPNEPSHTAALGAAYHGRILELATKGMHQEALALFGNMTTFCGPATDQGLRLALLLNGGRWQEAATLYAESLEALPRKRRNAIETFLAAQLLSGNQTLARNLPPQSAIVRQHQLAQEAMTSYAKGENGQALEQLGTLPFSSPFKDFALILKALIGSHSGKKSSAQELLAKITANSPFQPLATLCCQTIGTMDKAALMAQVSGPEQAFLAELLGLDAKIAPLIASQSKAFSHPEQLFLFILSRRQVFGEAIAESLCLALLPHLPNKSIKVYEKNFRPLPPFESYRIQALSHELRHDLQSALYAWRAAIIYLEGERPVNSLRLALLYRHLADTVRRVDQSDDAIQSQVIVLLKESLRHDPNHKSTHLQILELSKGQDKVYEAQLNDALKVLPNDVDILLLAIESAIARGSFKKATRFAEGIIAIDPINSRARTLLVNAHLSHGRKLVQSGKHGLANKEFESAAGHDRANFTAGTPQLCLGLVGLLNGEQERSEGLLAKAMGLAESEAVGRFALCMEARLLGLGSKWQKKFNDALRSVTSEAPPRETFLGLIKQCNRHKTAYEPPACRELLGLLDKFIKQAVAFDYTETESLVLCDFFNHFGLYPVLQNFAGKAAAMWPNAIIFSYHQYFAKARGGDKALNDRDCDELDYLASLAEERHDSKTAKLIDELIELTYGNDKRYMDDDIFSSVMDYFSGTTKGGREIDKDDSSDGTLPKELLDAIEKKKKAQQEKLDKTPERKKPEQQRLF